MTWLPALMIAYVIVALILWIQEPSRLMFVIAAVWPFALVTIAFACALVVIVELAS